jgi:hypothetical protein
MKYGEETNRAEFMISSYTGCNENEPNKASLRKLAVINLPEMVKSGA